MECNFTDPNVLIFYENGLKCLKYQVLNVVDTQTTQIMKRMFTLDAKCF